MENHQCKASNMDGVRSEVKVIKSSSIRSWPYEIVLRVFGLVFTLVATIVVGVDKESKIISITLFKGLPPLYLHASAKWEYLSALQYFVVSNGIACSYAALSLAFAIAVRAYKDIGTGHLLLIIFDLLMMGLLFSADGAAAAVGVLGRHGNSHMEWRRVCDFFEGYCRHSTMSLAMSVTGSVVFMLLVVLSVLNLNKNSK